MLRGYTGSMRVAGFTHRLAALPASARGAARPRAWRLRPLDSPAGPGSTPPPGCPQTLSRPPVARRRGLSLSGFLSSDALCWGALLRCSNSRIQVLCWKHTQTQTTNTTFCDEVPCVGVKSVNPPKYLCTFSQDTSHDSQNSTACHPSWEAPRTLSPVDILLTDCDHSQVHACKSTTRSSAGCSAAQTSSPPPLHSMWFRSSSGVDSRYPAAHAATMSRTGMPALEHARRCSDAEALQRATQPQRVWAQQGPRSSTDSEELASEAAMGS